MAINWKVHRCFIILIAIATALGLLGFLDSLGYPFSYQLIGGVNIGHVIATAQAYVAYIMWKRYA